MPQGKQDWKTLELEFTSVYPTLTNCYVLITSIDQYKQKFLINVLLNFSLYQNDNFWLKLYR